MNNTVKNYRAFLFRAYAGVLSLLTICLLIFYFGDTKHFTTHLNILGGINKVNLGAILRFFAWLIVMWSTPYIIHFSIEWAMRGLKEKQYGGKNMEKQKPDNPFDSTSWDYLEKEVKAVREPFSSNAYWLRLMIEGKNIREIGKEQTKYARQLTYATYVLAFATIGLIIATLIPFIYNLCKRTLPL